MTDLFFLTQEPISLEKYQDLLLNDGENGALVTFYGITRKRAKGIQHHDLMIE
jgi:molybdopterin synthase catalytic subunit